MYRFRKLIIILGILASFGCNPAAEIVETGEGKSTAISPAQGLGGLKGKLVNAQEIWPNRPLFIYTAQFYGEPEGEGAFILEPALFPSAELEQGGFFQINNIPPRRYVLIIGPNAESGLAIREGGIVAVFEVRANLVLDIGDLFLDT